MKLLRTFSLPLFLILIGFLWGKPALGQAEVHLYSGEIITGEIIEETDTQISLEITSDSILEILILDKAQIRLVYLENGQVIRYNRKPLGNLIQRYSDLFEVEIPYKQEIFLSPFSVLENHIEFGYERRLIDRLGIEISFGIIGSGLGESIGEINIDNLELLTLPNGEEVQNGIRAIAEGEKGFLIKVGPKIMFRTKNSLQGIYLKPEWSFHRFTNSGSGFKKLQNEPSGDYDFTWNFRGGSSAMIFKLGVQKIFFKRLTLDYNIGLGFGKDYSNLMTAGDYSPNKGGIPIRYTNFERQIDRYTHRKVNIADIDMLLNHEFSIGFLL